MEHIKSNIGKYEFIFVSTHKEVREALRENCLHFYLLYPYIGDKEKYIERYRERGSPPEFLDLLADQWTNWLDECIHCTAGCTNLMLVSDYIGVALDYIKREKL